MMSNVTFLLPTLKMFRDILDTFPQFDTPHEKKTQKKFPTFTTEKRDSPATNV